MKKNLFFFLFSMSLFWVYAQVPTNGLVASYPFNCNANDASGNGNNGTVHGATLTTDRCGNPNRAYYFNGNSYIQVPYSPSLNSHTNGLSVSFWVYSNNNDMVILCKSGWENNHLDYRICWYQNYPEQLICNSNFANISVNNIQNQWFHFVFVYENNFFKLYKDGILFDGKNGTFHAWQFFNQNTDLYIGADPVGEVEYMLGKIDDIYIYNRVLTDNEIFCLYNQACPLVDTIYLCTGDKLPNGLVCTEDTLVYDIVSSSYSCDSLVAWQAIVEDCPCDVSQTVTVRFKPDSAIGQDAVIATHGNCILNGNTQPTADMNGGNDFVLHISTWSYDAQGCPKGIARSLLKFDDLSTIPINAVIISAKLKLFGIPPTSVYGNSCHSGSPYNSYCPNTSFIQRITSTWDEQTVTWNTQPNTDTTNQITIIQSNTQWNWNFTDSSTNLLAMVQDWVQNPSTNFGFMIRLETEDIYRGLYFASSNHSDTALHPELIVTYELKQGGKKDTTEINETICDGEMYSKNGFNDSISGTYTHNLQNRFGCDSTVILTLYVAAKDTVPIFDTICDGETYSQNGFNESKSGIYYQYLQNIFGCDSLVELNLTVKQTPDIEIIAITDNFCDKDFVELQLITNGDSFLWSTGSSENPITITKSGVYSATAFIKDCEKTAEYTVEECPCELWLPNVFTPNNDGVNDDFIPVVRANLASFSMYIYDRWGQIIYKTDSYTPWDGTCNGRYASAGVYFCVISYSCANEPEKIVNKQGSVTLVR